MLNPKEKNIVFSLIQFNSIEYEFHSKYLNLILKF